MRRSLSFRELGLLSAILFLLQVSCKQSPQKNKDTPIAELREEGKEGEENEGLDEYDSPAEAVDFEKMITLDPVLNRVPKERLIPALDATLASQYDAPSFISAYGSWEERGPVSDVVGPSNGNTRANNGVAAGRVRAVLVDANDVTGKTVFIGGIDGGLWKTTDITTSPANWNVINDYFSNLAVSAICQDPTNKNIMYFSTGESYFNGDAVRGVGVFKSTDAGNSWALLPSTSTYTQCTRMVCDAAGNIYLGTLTGLFRSTNGGTTWTGITPTGGATRIADLEISSTGRLHVTTGLSSATGVLYRFTDIPSTVTAAGWTAPAGPFPFTNGNNSRIELGCSGNTLYALPSDNSALVPTIYKSTDGGNNWSATTSQPTAGWASGQAWYSLTAGVNPADPNQCIIGGLDNFRTLDGGNTWTKISAWVGTTGQYVHADQHVTLWYNNGNSLIFGSDGGIFYSSDGGTTIRDRNAGLRIKQFYSVAVHPTTTDYFLAGAQDNGTHKFSAVGLGSTVEVTGGDGAFTAIDQNQPQYQFGAYVYQTYRRSVNSGANWSSINFYLGTNTAATNFGNFINAFDYDNTNNIMYAPGSSGNYFRWTDPQTLASGSYYFGGTPSWPATASQVSLTALNSSSVRAVTVSPYTNNRLYLGTAGGRVVYIDNANTAASGSAGVNISTGLPAASVSCIATGTDDNNLMVTYSSYGVQHVWVSTNGGTSWTNITGNLPDMPVRWCMFTPGSNTKAIIATETGVWLTQGINGSSTSWLSSPTFPPVRTDMIKYRPSDGLLVAATHGRGVWTQSVLSVVPLNNFGLKGRWNGKQAELNWTYEDLPLGAVFQPESSVDGIHFHKIGTVPRTAASNYSFALAQPESKIFYRIKAVENTGAAKYSNVVKITHDTERRNISELISLYPNPVGDQLNVEIFTGSAQAVRYSISNSVGQVLVQKTENILFAGYNTFNLNVSALSPGTYFFTVLLKDFRSTRSFIKQ